MGEWISNNILLPIMYFLIDISIAISVLILMLYLLEKITDSQVIEKIRRR
tara:strand:- start:5052 stop:5201 length:150 start_codon:yes stop_codon:yes gene_type:complete